MNRRTFLKAAAITTIGIPTLAQAKEKSRWISFAERLPKPGQKIVITGVVDKRGINYYLRGGTVTKVEEKGSNLFAGVYMVRDFEKHVYHFDSSIHIFYTEGGKQAVKSKKWLTCNHGRQVNSHEINPIRKDLKVGYVETQYRKTYYFWLPVDGEYPETLPPFPQKKEWMLSPYLPGNRSRWFEYLRA